MTTQTTTTEINIEYYYRSLIITNENNGWIEPVLLKYWEIDTEFADFFCIQLKDFEHIESNYQVRIFKITKRLNEITIYCQVK
jgi:hypothetical protein